MSAFFLYKTITFESKRLRLIGNVVFSPQRFSGLIMSPNEKTEERVLDSS